MTTQLATDWSTASRPGHLIGHTIEVHEAIGSTNDRARSLLDEPGGEGVIVVAELQTAGRGRRGRSWTSPAARNLMASLAVRPRLPAAQAWRLGLATALAVHDGCARVADVRLKWPNDLVAADGRKLGGLLVETSIEADRLTGAVLGFGINVNWPRAEMPEEVRGTATSLLEIAGRPVDRAALLAAICERLETELDELEAGRSPLDRYRAACTTLGTNVRVRTEEGVIEGMARDVVEGGSLLLETGDGPRAVHGGEVLRVRQVEEP